MLDNETRVAISIREAAKACDYSQSAITKAIREGKLKAVRPGGNGDYRIYVEDLKSWLNGDGQPLVKRPSPNQR
jgi:excisionase family DNA binding protein